MKKNSGFALLEILLAISISSVLFSVAILSFPSLERLNLYYYAHSIQSHLRYCQKNALDEHRKYALSFAHNNSYYFYISRADDSGLLRKISPIYSLPNNFYVTTSSKYDSIAYTPNGTPSDPCTIRLVGKKYYIEITVLVGSGRVKIYFCKLKQK